MGLSARSVALGLGGIRMFGTSPSLPARFTTSSTIARASRGRGRLPIIVIGPTTSQAARCPTGLISYCGRGHRVR